jgi:hypothetical protein
MKHKKFFIGVPAVVVIGIITVSFLSLFPVSFKQTFPEAQPSLPPGTILSAEQTAADRDQMIIYAEDIHPYFALTKNKSPYTAAEKVYQDKTDGPMTVEQFSLATAEYLCFFRDGHTEIEWEPGKILDIEWEYRNRKLYPDNSTQFVTAIGNVPVEAFFSSIDSMRPAENEAAQARNYTEYCRYEVVMHLTGCTAAENSVPVTFSDGNTASYKFLPAGFSSECTHSEKNSCYIDDGIFIVDFNTCIDDDGLKAIAEKLHQAVKNGTTKVILDARGNGGGNSKACTRLLAAMDMKPPEYSMFVRYSPEAEKQCGYFRKSGSYNLRGKGRGKPNSAVHLVVLTDCYTFSSATMLAVFVRDGKLGTIIGEPSSNMPSSYGDIIRFQLRNSHINGTISHKRFIRPDRTKTDERMLIPDIRTNSEDALNTAVKYLKGISKNFSF